jgi:hypothetical protein
MQIKIKMNTTKILSKLPEMSIVQVPWRRRLQTLSLLHYVLVWLLVPFVCLWVPVYVLMFTQYWWWVRICALF